MHCEIDASGAKRLFNFLCEHALGADLGQGDVGYFVAGSVDDFDFNFVATSAEKRGDVVGLPEGELGAAGADAESRSVAKRMVHIERFGAPAVVLPLRGWNCEQFR